VRGRLGASASSEVRVDYEDTDAAGVVHPAGCLRFLEHARTEWLRDLSFEQGRLIREEGTVFAAAGLKLDFLKPARFNDRLSVDVVLLQLGLANLTLAHSITRQANTRQAITPESANHEAVISGPEVLRGTVRRVLNSRACLDAAGLRAKPLPPSLRSALRHGS
jgi:acyl-CoA thioester hydrolase